MEERKHEGDKERERENMIDRENGGRNTEVLMWTHS